jgi:hypothetical protein
MSREIRRTLQRAVLNDYYTASVKSEVTLDTLLTPVIAELLSIGTGKNLKYITKEFPIIEGKESRGDFRSSKADFFLSDDDYIYFVELKTTADSYNDEQYKKYLSICEKEKNIGEYGSRLIELLSLKYFDEEIQEKCFDKDKLDSIVTRIMKERLKFKEDVDLKKVRGEIKSLCDNNRFEDAYQIREQLEDKLRTKMKENNFTGTKKFIMQAFQMCISDEDFLGDKKIRVIYLMPKEPKPKDIADTTATVIVNKLLVPDDKEKEIMAFYTFDWLIDIGRCREKTSFLDWLIEDILKRLFSPDKVTTQSAD